MCPVVQAEYKFSQSRREFEELRRRLGIAKDRNTFAKNQREMERKTKAEEKRQRRNRRKQEKQADEANSSNEVNSKPVETDEDANPMSLE